ncbi:MAG: hypothetical protein ACRD2Y_03845 [Terriglobales bacterium]
MPTFVVTLDIAIAPHGVDCASLRFWILADETEVDGVGRKQNANFGSVRRLPARVRRLLHQLEDGCIPPGQLIQTAIERDGCRGGLDRD